METNDRPAGDVNRRVIWAIAAAIVVYVPAVSTGAIGLLENHAAAHGAEGAVPHLWAVLPFVILLGAIAVGPLAETTRHWWENNLHKFLAAMVLALCTAAYAAWGHPRAGFALAGGMLRHTVLFDYVPFMTLLFSLYVISGGIRIEGDLPAHSLTNSLFMAAGAAAASFIGTTGAAMLLIRPLLETNQERRHVAHTVVFFIFVVCNCGGVLLPIGDPPLFLGYLQGVEFLWTLSLWKSWLFMNSALIGVYFLLDHWLFFPQEERRDVRLDEARVRPVKVSGLWPNLPLLVGVVLGVALLDPSQVVPGTDWRPWPFLREVVQLGLVGLSLRLGAGAVREANQFNYAAIIEVAALFAGIFVCMQPALEILQARGGELGIDSAREFFWAAGSLSSVLDNAPTYLVFFKTAQALPPGEPAMAGVTEGLLAGISLGAVYMGAMTYIGNGPNFMVKAIAEASGVRMPSFFGYLLYSLGVMAPLLLVHSWLFLG